MNQIRKIESGVATAIFLLILFPLLYWSITENVFHLQQVKGYKFHQYHQVFDYYIHYLLPLLSHITVVYGAFLFMHLLIVPAFLEQRRWWPGIIFSALTFLVVFLVIMVSYTWYYGYLFGVYKTVKGVHTHCVKAAFIITVFYTILYVLYYAARYLYLTYLHPELQLGKRRQAILRETGILGLIWLLLLLITFSTPLFKSVICFGPFFAFIYLICQYHLFPRHIFYQQRSLLFRGIALFSMAGMILPLLVFSIGAHLRGEHYLVVILILLLIEVTIILPLSWWIFTLRHSRTTELKDLKKALNHSEAGLDFLRWQINPHFLFNALNTLYGTALHEQAPATGEGIQKLGDMMRFMLHDNTLESIALSKEIAYLQNYIALQRLRTQASPDIVIEVNINETHCEHEIAPMLLIPFVENAFKYGISLRNRSRITVSLSCTAEKIYFDVYNTIHVGRSQDIEQDSMGIGLNNVRQRLALLYPDKHELNIRETGTDFFVHLTIEVGEMEKRRNGERG